MKPNPDPPVYIAGVCLISYSMITYTAYQGRLRVAETRPSICMVQDTNKKISNKKDQMLGAR